MAMPIPALQDQALWAAACIHISGEAKYDGLGTNMNRRPSMEPGSVRAQMAATVRSMMSDGSRMVLAFSIPLATPLYTTYPPKMRARTWKNTTSRGEFMNPFHRAAVSPSVISPLRDTQK